MAGVDGNFQLSHQQTEAWRFARQLWRAWIETPSPTTLMREGMVRPPAMAGVDGNTNVLEQITLDARVRPPAMAGVDGNFLSVLESIEASLGSPASYGGRGLKLKES